MTERRSRTSGIQEELMGIVQRYQGGHVMSINMLMQEHSMGTTLRREQVSSAMNSMLHRGLLPGLAAGPARGTWTYNPTKKAAANQPEHLLIEIVATDPNGKLIGVDRDNAGVYRMERIA